MKGKLRIVGQIKDGKSSIGYCLLDLESNRVASATTESALGLVRTWGCENARVNENGELEGTEASLNRLPIYSLQGAIIGQARITVLQAIEKDDMVVGFYLMDAYGRKLRLSYRDTIAAIRKFGCTNAKLVERDNKIIVSAILGNFERFTLKSTPKLRKRSVVKADDGIGKASEQEVKGRRESEKKKFTRKMSDARYLGRDDHYAGGIFNDKKDVGSRGSRSRYSRAVRDQFRKLMIALGSGKYSDRTENRYPNTILVFNELKALGEDIEADMRLCNGDLEASFLKDYVIYGFKNAVRATKEGDYHKATLKGLEEELSRTLGLGINRGNIYTYCRAVEVEFATGENKEAVFKLNNDKIRGSRYLDRFVEYYGNKYK